MPRGEGRGGGWGACRRGRRRGTNCGFCQHGSQVDRGEVEHLGPYLQAAGRAAVLMVRLRVLLLLLRRCGAVRRCVSGRPVIRVSGGGGGQVCGSFVASEGGGVSCASPRLVPLPPPSLSLHSIFHSVSPPLSSATSPTHPKHLPPSCSSGLLLSPLSTPFLFTPPSSSSVTTRAPRRQVFC